MAIDERDMAKTIRRVHSAIAKEWSGVPIVELLHIHFPARHLALCLVNLGMEVVEVVLVREKDDWELGRYSDCRSTVIVLADSTLSTDWPLKPLRPDARWVVSVTKDSVVELSPVTDGYYFVFDYAPFATQSGDARAPRVCLAITASGVAVPVVA